MGGLLLGGRFDAHRQPNAIFARQRISPARQLYEQDARRKARLGLAGCDSADGGLIHSGLFGKIALAEALAL